MVNIVKCDELITEFASKVYLTAHTRLFAISSLHLGAFAPIRMAVVLQALPQPSVI